MKILQIHNDYQIFGGESAVLANEKKLYELNGFDVDQFVVSNDLINDYNLLDKVKFIKETVSSKRHIPALIEKINEFKPDVAHVHNVFPLLSPSIYVELKKQNIKVIQTIHNFRFMCPNGLFFTKGAICEKCSNGNFLNAVINSCYKDSKIFSAIYGYSLHYHNKKNTMRDNIDHLVCLSDFARKKFIEFGFDANKISVKPNFIFEDDNEDEIETEDYFLFIGRLEKTKGIYLFLEIAKKLPNFKFKVLGSGPDEDRMKEITKNQEITNIDYLGYQTGEVKDVIIKKSIAIISPSIWYEMFPMIILEAFKFKKSVITTDLGGKSEIISHNKNGFLFKPENYNDVINLIKSKNVEDFTQMGKNAYKDFKEKYSENKNIDHIKKIIFNY